MKQPIEPKPDDQEKTFHKAAHASQAPMVPMSGFRDILRTLAKQKKPNARGGVAQTKDQRAHLIAFRSFGERTSLDG
jgi:hypothetical protein